MKSLCALFILFEAAVTFLHADLLFMYAENEKIYIQKTTSVEIVKEITVSHYDRMLVAHNYKEDLIFYSYDDKLYRIHLVDDNGDRRISGKGELLTNPNADHVEVKKLDGEIDDIKGIFVDEENNSLFVSTYSEIYQYDLNVKNGKVIYKPTGFSTIQSLTYHQGMLYFSLQPNWKTTSVHRFNLKTKKVEELVGPIKGDIFALTVDVSKNALLYRSRSEIRVIQIDLPAASYPVKDPKIVLSDSKYTGGYGLQPIASDSRVLIWLSKKQLFLATINKEYSFISKRNVRLYRKTLYGSFRPYNIRTFHHTFGPPFVNPPKKIQCINI